MGRHPRHAINTSDRYICHVQLHLCIEMVDNTPIYWISVDGDEPITDESLRAVKDAVQDMKDENEMDSDFVISTKEVEPLDRSELVDYLNQLLDAVGD